MALALGAIFVLFALLSLSASTGAAGKKRSIDTLIGGVLVGAVVFALSRVGLGWVGIVLALLWSAARRWSPSARGPAPAGEEPPRAGPARGKRMTREEALAVLGLTPGVSREQIRAQYRRLMKKVHPDQGGTTYLATRLNEAKDVLLGSDNA